MTAVEPIIPEWSLGERMAKARRDAGYDQRRMAEAVGVSASAIAQWETDRSRPRDLLDLVNRWSEVTGVSRAWLLGVIGAEDHPGSRTGSVSTLAVTTNPDPHLELTLPFDRQLAAV